MTVLYSLRNKKGKTLVQSVSEEYLKDLLLDDTLKQETELSVEHWQPFSSFSSNISDSALISLRSRNGQILLERAHLQDVIACIEMQQHRNELEFCLEQWIPAVQFSFEADTEKLLNPPKTTSSFKKNVTKSLAEKKITEDEHHEKTIISAHLPNIFTSSYQDESQADEKQPEATTISQPEFFPQNFKEADTQKVKPKISFESLFDDDSGLVQEIL